MLDRDFKVTSAILNPRMYDCRNAAMARAASWKSLNKAKV